MWQRASMCTADFCYSPAGIVSGKKRRRRTPPKSRRPIPVGLVVIAAKPKAAVQRAWASWSTWKQPYIPKTSPENADRFLSSGDSRLSVNSVPQVMFVAVLRGDHDAQQVAQPRPSGELTTALQSPVQPGSQGLHRSVSDGKAGLC